MLEIINNITYLDVVKKLIEQNIVAIFQGKSECGARALGNRSILFDPRVPNGKQIVNVVKKREEFRPFAGSILCEHADEWFDMMGMEESPFMTYSLDCRESKRDLIPAIVHVDNTCRIQTVKEEQNFHYYNLIKTFYRETNVPIILNTSFNLAGEPMVETPEDAIETIFKSDIDCLYFPEINCLVDKKWNGF